MRILLPLLLTLTCFSLSAQLTNNGATIVIEQGAVLAVEGSAGIVNNTGIITNSGGVVMVSGDLMNAGTLTSNSPNSILRFTGDQDAVFTPGNNLDLSIMQIEKEEANLILAGPLSISGGVDFSGADNGRLLLGDSDLTFDKDAVIDGADPTKHIVTDGDGFVIREVQGLTTVAFPLGSLDGYSPLTSDYTGTAGSGATIKVRVSPLAAADLPEGTDDFLKRHWEVVATGITNYGNEVSATYLPTDVQGEESVIEGASFADGFWFNDNSGRNGSMVTGRITGLDAIFTGYNSVALPTELVGFDAAKVNEKIARLSWSTASEINASHFDIERSTDGYTWSSIGAVTATGESNSLVNYQFLDNTLTDDLQGGGLVYYRLNMVDFDGSHEYSPVRSLVFDVFAAGLTVFPNPTADRVSVLTSEVVTSLTLRDNLGKHLVTTTDETLSLANYPAGVYFLTVTVGDRFETLKLLRVE